MKRIIEILLYTMKPGTGAEFHRIMKEISVPLHNKMGIDIVAYGNSLHDPDAYFLIRSFESLDQLNSTLDSFYKSEAWRNGPRTDIIERISTSLKSVVSLHPEAIDELKRSGL